MGMFEKAREFVYRNARPLDIARWQYHFENGSKEAIINTLSFYQNKDGGFGHALEADSWNPNSSPIQTWNATEILREIGFVDTLHPIIQGILKYLANEKDFNGQFWYNTVRSNNDYPHAPWWHTESDSTCHNDYNPTACLAGFIVRFAEKESELYQLGCRIVKEAYEQMIVGERENDMHTTACYISMMEYCKEAHADVIDLVSLESKLRKVVSASITKDTAQWEHGYICKPSQFICSKDSVFYPDNKEIVDFECDFIAKTQLEDGSWNIPWSWSDYPEQWAVSKNWWRSNGVLVNILFLKSVK
ncbi:hypothetical protein A3842_24350 [Paenibacillus sp. P3E]|nr:hypothetical protein A3842_24350 [Paenibacillus sp. P3E]